MKMLNHFLKQIGESKHLLECQETKIFLKPAAEFADELNKIKKENHQELSDKYEKVFDDFIYDVNELNQKELHVRAHITKVGRSLVFAEAACWSSEDPEKLTATASVIYDR